MKIRQNVADFLLGFGKRVRFVDFRNNSRDIIWTDDILILKLTDASREGSKR